MVANLGKRDRAARRGTRRRPRREPALVWWALFAALGGVAWWLHSWRAALLVLLGWCFYQFAFVPTACRVSARPGAVCTERTRGRLFACGPGHQRLRNDALWRLAGLRALFRKRPPRDGNESGAVSPDARGRLPLPDRLLILVAAAGTVAVLAGLVHGFR